MRSQHKSNTGVFLFSKPSMLCLTCIVFRVLYQSVCPSVFKKWPQEHTKLDAVQGTALWFCQPSAGVLMGSGFLYFAGWAPTPHSPTNSWWSIFSVLKRGDQTSEPGEDCTAPQRNLCTISTVLTTIKEDITRNVKFLRNQKRTLQV